MKTSKISTEDVAKLIGYTRHTVYNLTLKSDEYIMLWLKKHKIPRAKYVFGLIKVYQAQVRKQKVYDKTPLERNINDVVREKKQNELFIVNEKISRLEGDMKAVIFDREINSQLQALYIKRECLHQFLGIKDEAKTEFIYDTQGIPNRDRVQADCACTRVGDMEECARRLQGHTRHLSTLTKRGVYHGGV